MKLLKRVAISVLRRKTFSLVLLVFTFLFGNVIAMSNTIKQNSEGIKDNLLNRIGGKIVLESSLSNYDSVKKLNDDEYKDEWEVFHQAFDRFSNKDEMAYSELNYHYGSIYLDEPERYDLNNRNYGYHDSYLHGVSSSVFVDEKEGLLSLEKGSYFTEEMLSNGDSVIIVSNSVLKDGKPIEIGDELSFSFVVQGYDDVSSVDLYRETISYKVIGIYEQVENKYSDIQNELDLFYVPNQNLLKYYTIEKEFEVDNTIFKVNKRIWIDNCVLRVASLENLESIGKGVKNYLEDTRIMSYTSNDSVEGLLGPIQIFSNLASNILYFSLGAMVIVSGLITFYFVRDRKHEIGIYISLGMKKIELVAQIILETLAVGLLGIVLSIGSGIYLSQTYSQNLLKSTIIYENEEKDKYTTGHQHLNPDQLSSEDIVSQYEVKIEGKDIVMLIEIGVCTLVLSSIIPLTYIVRLKPKNIMME